MKEKTAIDPFISLNVRAFIEAKDPYEVMVILAMNFWYWWKDDRDGLGIEGIAALGKLSAAQAKRVVARLKAKGWIEASRPFGGKSRYRLVIPKMSFKEAYSLASNWLPQSQLSELQLAPTEPPISSDRANNGLPQSPPNIKRSEEKTQTQEKDLIAHPEGLKHRQALGIYIKLWGAAHQGKKYYPTGKDQARLKELLQAELAPEYFEAKARGYLADKDPFTKQQAFSLSYFCSAFNKWPALDAEAPRRSEMEGLA